MKKEIKKLIVFITYASLFLAFVSGIILITFEKNTEFYNSPSEFMNSTDKKKKYRLGGLVKKNSLKYRKNKVVTFEITDFENSIKVLYKGLLPKKFNEEQRVVVIGEYRENDKIFYAIKILAKINESDKPPIK
jgi:cytochrome c-type biogenesis protein CcmE